MVPRYNSLKRIQWPYVKVISSKKWLKEKKKLSITHTHSLSIYLSLSIFLSLFLSFFLSLSLSLFFFLGLFLPFYFSLFLSLSFFVCLSLSFFFSPLSFSRFNYELEFLEKYIWSGVLIDREMFLFQIVHRRSFW